jgi:hypothetical protein
MYRQRIRSALIHWLVPVSDAPDPDTGIWVVELEREQRWPSFLSMPSRVLPTLSACTGLENTYFVNFVNPYADHDMYQF